MTRGDRARGVAALMVTTALLLVTLLAASAQAAGIDFGRCGGAEKRDTSRCGRLSVPLDRSGALPGRVSLKVRVLPARTRQAAGTIFALAGGPGQAATPLVGQIATALGTVARSRRVVTFDQRGTGGSGRLRCKALANAGISSSLGRVVANCAAQLGPRRAAYTTAASVEDLEAVRAALGVEKIVVFGVSYGTKVALDYAARYPQHVSRLVLDSVVLPEGVDPFMRTTIGSIPRVLSQLCAGRSACRFTRDASSDLERLVAKIGRGGGRLGATRFDGRGRPRRVAITREQLLSLLMDGDFDPTVRGAVPGAVRGALDGDTAPLAKLLDRPSVGLDGDADSDALFIATSCEDGGVPWPVGTPFAERPRAFRTMLGQLPEASLAPFDRATLQRSGIDYCAGWPEAPIAQPSAPLPDVPTLILSGDDDLRTPRRDAQTLAQRIPSAQLVTVPESGHSVLGADILGCAERALRRFFQNKRVRDCELELPRLVTPSAPAPRTLAAVAPSHGVPGRAGRTLAAVEQGYLGFVQDMLTQVFARLGSGERSFSEISGGGLRGGCWRVTRTTVTLRRYSAVPGVTLDLTIRESRPEAPIAIRVGGAAAARGTLRIGDRRVSGRLGGRRIDFDKRRFGAGAARAASAGGAGAESELPSARELLAQLAEAERSAAERAPLAAAPRLPGGRGAR